MEQRKIEHITLHLIVFGTIAIIGVLARQTVLHYGWDEFSSYLILVVCSIVIGAIYLNLQIAFRQLLSPTIERCFMRFESYRNKTVVAEIPIEHHEVIESAADIESIVSESEIENETPSDTTEEVSTLSLSESNEDSTELPKNEATSSIINNTPIEESSQPTEYEIYHATAMAEKVMSGRNSSCPFLQVNSAVKWNVLFPMLSKSISFTGETALRRL